MSKHHVYILYSERLDRYYVGNTDLDPLHRLRQHNEQQHKSAYTASGVPWTLIYVISCGSRLQSRRIELHIKRMKSKIYIQNLQKYGEIAEKLLAKYSTDQE